MAIDLSKAIWDEPEADEKVQMSALQIFYAECVEQGINTKEADRVLVEYELLKLVGMRLQ